MGHRRCRGATAPWAAACRRAVPQGGSRSAPHGRRAARRGAGPGATGRSAVSRHAGPGFSALQDSFRTAGPRLRAVRKRVEQWTGPRLRSRAVHTPGTEQTSTHPPVTSPARGLPCPTMAHFTCQEPHVRPDLSGPSALTVFTSCDEMATPRNRRGEPSGAAPRRACIPVFHSQTRCCRREFTRPRRRGHAPPHARDHRLGHTAVPPSAFGQTCRGRPGPRRVVRSSAQPRCRGGPGARGEPRTLAVAHVRGRHDQR